MVVFDDFKPFFDANPGAIYTRRKGPGQGPDTSMYTGFQENHAVVLVGYDDEQQFWVVRNSWGPGFAQGGYFRVSGCPHQGVGCWGCRTMHVHSSTCHGMQCISCVLQAEPSVRAAAC